MAEKTEFLPFHAINEFMRPDFRLNVIRETLNSQSSVPESFSNALNQQIKKNVKVPGFRSSDKAPALVKVLPTSKAFEKSPELVAALLACWAEIQSQLREQVFSLFVSRHWKMYSGTEGSDSTSISLDLIKEWPIFPINFNRSKLPGFFTHWPKGEDFETLYKSFSESYPQSEVSIDKVSLMVVWLSMRLPFQVDVDLENPQEPAN
jgi:hypothetical protein